MQERKWFYLFNATVACLAFVGFLCFLYLQPQGQHSWGFIAALWFYVVCKDRGKCYLCKLAYDQEEQVLAALKAQGKLVKVEQKQVGFTSNRGK